MSNNLPPNMQVGGINREYQSVLADLTRMIPSLLPEWTYKEGDDFGIVLLQQLSYLADHLHYRADATFRDMAPLKTPHREVLRQFAEWLGYMAQRATPAEAILTLTLAAPLADDLVIPRFTRFSGAGPNGTAFFETITDTLIPGGDTSVTVTAVEGQAKIEVLLGLTTGRAFERFTLPQSNAIYNWGDTELEVTVGGIEATHYVYPALIQGQDLAYWVRQNPEGLLELRFGDGTFGRLLPPNVEVRCTYRAGGGVIGNVQAGAIDTVVSTVLDSSGSPVTLSVTNPQAAARGFAEESLESLRETAPAYFRTQNRAVTQADYHALVMSIPGVFRASVVPQGVNGVHVYVVSTNVSTGATVSEALKARIVREIDPKRMATDVVSVFASSLVKVDVRLLVRAHRNARNGTVREAVRQRFISDTGIFYESRNDLGKPLYLSDMIAEIEAVPGVNNLDVQVYTRRPRLVWSSASGNAVLSTANPATVGPTAIDDVWTITMLNATEFTVAGEYGGFQEQIGQLGVTFLTQGGTFKFMIAAGATPMAEGDWGTIRTGKLVGNVILESNEFPTFDARSVVIDVQGGLGG